MSRAHKPDERILKQIIQTNVTGYSYRKQARCPAGCTCKYYRRRRTSILIMRNNQNKKTSLMSANIVYKLTWGLSASGSTCICYASHMTTTLSRRLTYHYHKQNGEFKRRMREVHNTRITRQELVDKTEIIHRETRTKRLRVLEAVYIHLWKLVMNIQREHERILTLHDMTVSIDWQAFRSILFHLFDL